MKETIFGKIFGSINSTVGQNVMTAITGVVQQIGIPPYKYGEMATILSQALEPDEYDLICRGFGIGRSRQFQHEMAVELGLTEGQVSAKSRQVVAKLSKGTVRRQLEALAPSAEDLFDQIDKLTQEVANSKGLKETKYRLEAAENKLKAAEDLNRQLSAENAKLSHENDRLGKKLETDTEDLNRKNNRIADLLLRSYQAEAKGEVAKEAFDGLLSQMMAITEATKVSFAAATAKITVESGLEQLHLSEETLSILKKRGVNNLKELIRHTPHSLKRFINSPEAVIEIEDKLGVVGLNLRAS